MKIAFKYLMLLITILLIHSVGNKVFSDEIRLEGKWMFRVGDRMEWASPKYDDSDWDQIKVPSNWENQGFQGYDGYAWYRLSVYIPKGFENRELYLNLGYIDDVDETFINGTKVGKSGSFPPHHNTAYNAKRKYRVSGEVLNFGEENLIAVRVYDSKLSGGLLSGKFSLEASARIASFDIELTGEWMFNKGKKINEAAAKPILVPGMWENQGYFKYDGYAVYHRKVFISQDLAENQLILVAGKIDDVDQLFVNGTFVAGTGKYHNRDGHSLYREIRNYFIPKEVIKPGQENLIEIRVCDDRWDGGIVEGPVGIISQEKFIEYWRSKRKY